MLILTGPSACGKTEIAKLLIAKYNMKKMVTYTTRLMRVGEVDGVDYHFVSLEEFIKMKENNEFVETTYYNNNYYGSRKKDISFDKVVILDPYGVNIFSKVIGEEIITIFLNTPEDVRIQRMINRGDDDQIIQKRIPNDRELFKEENYAKIDFVVQNHNIDLQILADSVYKIYQKAHNKQ